MSAEPSRRDFVGRTLTYLLGGLSAAASVLAPAWALFGVADVQTVRIDPAALPLGKLAEFPEGTAREVRLRAPERDAWMTTPAEVGSVFVIRDGETARVLSATCPHLGCPVEYEAQRRQFACPCHRSVFALDGARISGPAPRGLDPLESSVSGGELTCRYQRFLPGSADRRPT